MPETSNVIIVTDAERAILRIRRSKLPQHEMSKKMALAIWDYELNEGSQWVLDELYDPFLIRVDGKALAVSLRDERFCRALTYTYGLAKSETVTKQVVERLAARAAHESEKVTTARFSHWTGKELLLSTYNGGTLLLDGGMRANKITNGEKVLFKDDDLAEPLLEVDYGDNGILFDTITGATSFSEQLGYSADDQRWLFLLWALSTCLPEALGTKPLLILGGDHGSGKTTLIKHLQYVLRGRDHIHLLQRTDQKDFPVKMLRSPIFCLDNLDTKFSWLDDILCSYATSGGWTQRKLYTNAEEVSIYPQSFVAITTRHPHLFSRVDLADRSIFLLLDRRPMDFRESELKHHIIEHRPKLFGELLYYLNCIVREYRNPPKVTLPYRMADFSLFCHIAGGVIGLSKDRIDSLLEKAEMARRMVMSATNPIVSMIHKWLSRHNGSFLSGTAQSILDQFLEEESQRQGVEVPSATSVGRALSKLAKDQDRASLKVKISLTAGSQRHYTISLPNPLTIN